MMLCWILISLFVGFLKAHEVIYAQVGGTVTLPREKKDAENVYVNWYRGNNITITRNPQRGIQRGKDTKTHANLLPDFSLQISPVQESDFEIWRCEQHILRNNFEKTYKLYHVTIPEVPAVIAGESLSLDCRIESSPVKPKVTWIPPENTDCNQRNLKGEKTVVNSVSRCHSGVWTCKLEYDSKQTEATTTVYVIDLSLSPDTVYTSSSEVEIPCSLSSNIPWPILKNTGLIGGNWSFTPLNDPKSTHSLLKLDVDSVRWIEIHDTVSSVKAKEIELKKLNLTIKLPVSENIRGLYTCDLIFSRKTLSRKVLVEVLKVSSSRGSPVYEGQSVNLTCTLGHQLTSDFEMKWNCSSYSSCSNFKLNSSTLFIPEVKLEHRGKYTCELWKNREKVVHADLFLKTEKAPVDIWLCVAISSGVVVFILLLVVIIMCIRRYRQTMMYRRRKTKFCCCKNPQQNQKGFYKT